MSSTSQGLGRVVFKMTQKRRNGLGTEFSLWLREQKEIDSSLGFIASDIDYVWLNYNTNDWMIIEEKRYGCQPKFYQQKILALLEQCCKNDPKFHGIHVLVFERTNPDDGAIFWDGQKITRTELLDILTFKNLKKEEGK